MSVTLQLIASLILIACVNLATATRHWLQAPESIPASSDNKTEITLTVIPYKAPVTTAGGRKIADITLRAYEYNRKTRFMGPTIHAKPGDIINVTLINNLTGVGRLDQISINIGKPTGEIEAYKDPDVTNLHTHGLHVDPNVDNVLLWASPRCTSKADTSSWPELDCYDEIIAPNVSNSANYPYRIPKDHYPGTHWYHAHWHGSVTFDVIQGLYGLFIIDDMESPPPMEPVELLFGYAWVHDDDYCKQLTNLTTNLTVNCPPRNLNLKYSRPNQTTNAYPFSFPVTSACFITCKMVTEGTLSGGIPVNQSGQTVHKSQLELSGIDIFPINFTGPFEEHSGIEGRELFFVNGQVLPNINMTVHKWYHFRMVNTVMNYLLFWVRNDTINNTTYQNCQFKVMGRDGVYFKDGMRNLTALPYQNNKVVIPPGSRADMAVHCKCSNAFSSDGQYCDYPIYASNRFEVDGVDGFAPVPRDWIQLLTLSVAVPDAELFGNESVFTMTDNWMPQSYDGTPYLTTTMPETVETDAFCAPGEFELDEMTQCNIVHGRQQYPSGTFFQGNNHIGQNASLVAMNQVQFDHNKTLAKVCTGNQSHFRTHEWMVTSNFHPFHHHTWPFQVQRDVTKGFLASAGDWRDTLGALGTFRMRSNYQVNDFAYNDGSFRYNFSKGALIMHCHYVPHEDHGMMQQVGLFADCSQIEGNYIVPEVDTTITTDTTVVSDITGCPEGNATSWINMLDVKALVGIEASISKDCYAQFRMVIVPRSTTVGNLWFGLTINDAPFDKSDPDINDTDTGNWRGNMTGNALIVNILASGHNQPLAKLDWTEVSMDPSLRTTYEHATRISTCEGFKNDGGAFEFKCRRPLCLACENNAFVQLKDGSKYFSYAYGEGQFRTNRTYHASRGGCAFSFNDILFCNISQNRMIFGIHESPNKPTTTEYFTTTGSGASTNTTEGEADSATNLSYFIAMIVIMILSIKLNE